MVYSPDENFLITEKEFHLIANKFENLQERLGSLLPREFLKEEIIFSQPIADQQFIAALVEQLIMFNQESLGVAQ